MKIFQVRVGKARRRSGTSISDVLFFFFTVECFSRKHHPMHCARELTEIPNVMGVLALTSRHYQRRSARTLYFYLTGFT